MTTPTPRPIPTPRDLAQRPARPAPAPCVSEALARMLTSLPDGSFLSTWYAGADSSSLRPNVRLVAAALATLADPDTGQIPDDKQPTASDLIPATGLSGAEIGLALGMLRQRCWLQRSRRALRPDGVPRRHLTLTIPAAYLPRLTTPAAGGEE
ncbi:hypothetical protein ACFQ60_22550 [Streptomyces zhihengii]|uniref:Uncharacterized protein n=1 Tax=Streptomyces zhihengii TaxID=1818004 RepID=A0ABS2UUN1_9ACTN|nr:hypothetical protein [Streptomyces zhihengii]MBM9620998.1 hypothetical protein [Streptomyces zhihengii]